MVLGNTFHLHLDPGDELIARQRRPAPVHALGRPDHHRLRRLPGLLDGPRDGRRRGQGPRGERRPSAPGGSSRSTRTACASAPTSTASEQFMGPETSMAIQANLGSDIALVFDECTPFHVEREYTQRSTERTHRWLDRCLDWHAAHGPGGPARLRDRAGRRLRGPAGREHAGGRRARVRRHRDRRVARRRQGADVRGRRLGDRDARRGGGRAPAPPARHRRDRRPRRAAWSAGSTRSTARCRRGWRATAWRSSPTRAGAGASISRRPRTATPTSRSWRAAPARRARSAGPAGTCATWRTTAS